MFYLHERKSLRDRERERPAGRHIVTGGAIASRAGRLADRPSPEEVPGRRRLIHGGRYSFAQRASSRRAASHAALVTASPDPASTAVCGGSAASGARQSSVTGTP